MSRFKTDWLEGLRDRTFALWLIFSLVTITLLGTFVQTYFQVVILPKPGILIGDYVLDMFTPIDWSLEILALLYTSVVISLASNYNKPWDILLGLSTFAIVSWMRMIAMYCITLEAPVDVIPLKDPFLSLVVYDHSEFVKDLFFSGHISSMAVMVVIETNKKRQWVLASFMTVMAVFILWQHVHYTIDVVVAVPVTFGVYALLKKYFIKRPLSN